MMTMVLSNKAMTSKSIRLVHRLKQLLSSPSSNKPPLASNPNPNPSLKVATK